MQTRGLVSALVLSSGDRLPRDFGRSHLQRDVCKAELPNRMIPRTRRDRVVVVLPLSSQGLYVLSLAYL